MSGFVEGAVGHAFAVQDLERVAALIGQFADQMNLQTNRVLLAR